jgi:hypothetical protein
MTNATGPGKRDGGISALARRILFLQVPPLLENGAVAKW